MVARRPPKSTAEIGTPFGSSHSSAITGHCDAGAQNREFGCAAGVSDAGVQSWRFQSVRCAGGSPSMPSHQTSPSSVRPTLVNTVLRVRVSIALGLVSKLVPGATPKSPNSGLIARRRPSSPIFIHAMSSPTVSAFQPGIDGMSIARLVLPHDDGNAAVMKCTLPAGEVSLRISMCSASQPSSRAITDAMRRAKHFLPSSALPP